MGISTSTGTLTAGQSRTFNLSPASAVTLTMLPNARVTITETPTGVSGSGLGGNATRVHEPRLPGTFTYGPYPMGGSVLVENGSSSGSTVTWVRSDSLIAESATGGLSLVGPDGAVFDSAASGYTIGSYYFPGWSTPGGGPTGPIQAAPWSVIPANRTPLIGQFDETQQNVCDYNMRLARDAGLSFFAYDWYASISGGSYVPYLDHAILNHQLSTVPKKPRYCINWAMQTNQAQFNSSNFASIYNHWIAQHFGDASYFLIDGKPVVMIFDVPVFKTQMGNTNAGVVAALNAARAAAVAAGYLGIHFIGVCTNAAQFWMDNVLLHGWDRITSYNTFTKYEVGADAAATSKTGFEIFDDAIFGPNEVIAGPTYHSWIGNAGYPIPSTLADTGTAWVAPTLTSNGWPSKDIKLMVPMSSGWDRRPWTYASTTQALPTTAQFEAHLINGRSAIDSYRTKTDGLGIITAWNEFGEGSYLMPTVGTGYSMLSSVRKVFGGMRL